jgi:hypothetical protein
MVRIFSSLNSRLQDILEFTPTTDLITHFCIMGIPVVNSPPAPPKIIYQTEGVSEILKSKCFESNSGSEFPWETWS